MYDLIIIGAGTAGITAYQEAIKYTQNILIVNDGSWDTTCARVGCMPSKVLISAANRMHEIENAKLVGLNVKAEINTSQVMQHVRTLRDHFTNATLKDVNSWATEHKISGLAQFINQNTIIVNSQEYQSKSFIVAVGSTPTVDSQWKEQLGDRLITSDQIFELEKLPRSLAVIGSGVIAIELAQAMQRLGVKTTVFARSRKVGALSSPALQKLAQDEISKNLNIKFETLPTRVQRATQGVIIKFEENNQPQQLNVEYLLVATGRKSYLDTLLLDNIDHTYTDLKKLPVNSKTKQLGDYPIFITGDAHTNTPIQHEAAHEGRQAVHNCLNSPAIKSLKTLTPLAIVFSAPEMAIAGQSFKQLSDAKIEFVTGMVSYEKQGRALVLAKNSGAIEVYIDQSSRKLLGAELFVEAAEHMAHMLAWMISENLTVDEIIDKPFYHPTLEEGLRTALKHARRQLK
ncbi:dihydrolipoyl dehydrogenase [Acinetobacter sp.]|uniref:dihydrolipoyl dehydrogenase n=1 Tax=Acinetobacter sp. TaxID=472 RepID=UPI0026480DFD|nr:dihydrolipoyl dehydrogenase [Acinetobacter sp.]MDN5513401.1 dihydrolipoyl dehydrogenase [Acinetobacter sp.]MDN5526050.1 dihydrolipoyl dehydrogenase [Acinetobacter sp.]